MKEDTLSIQQKELERQTFKQDFMKHSFLNPAIHFYRYNYSISNLSVMGKEDDQFASNTQELGDGYRGFKVNAKSYIKLSPNARVWGEAYYERGKKQNIFWNESADFEKVYPYVSADTIGGDMTQETYYFKGGYAKKVNRWTFGGEFSYRALLEFRKVDPRPRNTVADLVAKIAASYALTPHYAASLLLEGQKYKQNDDLKYFNELGVSKTFQLQGLGMSYKRFDGTHNNIDYEGNLWKFGVDLFPIHQGNGWMASASYSFQSIDKTIPSVNDIILNNLSDKLIQAELGWMSTNKDNRWGAKANIDYLKRDGEQNMYGDSQSNEYPLIAVAKDFNVKNISSYATIFWEKLPTASWYYGANLNMGYLSRKEKQNSTANKLNYDELDINLQLHSNWQWKNDMLGVRFAGGYRPNLKADMQINAVACPYAYEILQKNFEHFKANKMNAGLAVKWSHVFKGNKLAFLEASWNQLHETSDRDGHVWTVKAGLSF